MNRTHVSDHHRSSRDGVTAVARIAGLVPVAAIVVWLIVLPLPWGGVLPGGRLIATGGALLAGALALIFDRRDTSLRPLALPLAALGALALLGLIQWFPLPDTVIETLSPTSAELYHAAADSLSAAGAAPPPMRISLAPYSTADVTLRVCGVAAAVIAGWLAGATRARRRWIAGAVIASCAIQLTIAIVEGTDQGRLSGSFVNPNHLGSYLALGLGLAFGVLWQSLLAAPEHASRRTEEAAVRLERSIVPVLWRVLLWGLIAGGIALTRSRGAVLAAAAVTIAGAAAGAWRHRRRMSRRRLALAAGCALLLGVGLVAAATGGASIERILQSDPREVSSDSRTQAWDAALVAWKEFPAFGAGLGAFQEAFRRHQPEGLPGLWEFAHSDPLQLLVTGGAIGLALGFLAVVALFVTIIRGWRSQRHREEASIALGAMVALLAVLVHGFAEFNFSIPAILMTAAVVAGLGARAARAE